MVAAHRSLRGKRQSRQPPCRGEAGTWGGLQLRVIALGRPREKRDNHEARSPRFIASVTFPLAAPQGEERAATSKTRRRRSDTSGTRFFAGTASQRRRVPEVSLHRPPGARSSRPVPHSPPTLARSGHPVGCHAARKSREVALSLARGERRASQQHGPRRARPAPSLLPPSSVDKFRTDRHSAKCANSATC